MESHILETANRLRLIQVDFADDESELKNVEFLVRSILEIAPTLSDNQKDFVDKSLQEAGLRPKARQDNSIELDQKLKQKFKVGDECRISAENIAELSAILIDFVLKLEPLVWNT